MVTSVLSGRDKYSVLVFDCCQMDGPARTVRSHYLWAAYHLRADAAQSLPTIHVASLLFV